MLHGLQAIVIYLKTKPYCSISGMPTAVYQRNGSVSGRWTT